MQNGRLTKRPDPRSPGTEHHSSFAETKASKALSSFFLLIYALLFLIIYREYVSIEWGYTGLRYGDLSAFQLLLIGLAISTVGWVMPQRIGAPSSVILWLLIALIYVPTMIITLMIGEREHVHYYGDLAALTTVMFAASIIFRRASLPEKGEIPPNRFFIIFFGVFIIMTAIIYYRYGEIMSFSSIEDVYYQRFAASDVGAGGIMGYIRTYYLYVISVTLICAGFVRWGFWYLSIFGLLGFLVTYLVDASKIAFIIPLLMISFFVAHRFVGGKVWILNAGLAGLTLVSGLFAIYITGAKLLADLVLVRSMAIPAQTFAQYADIFASRGYTYWSNVRGISAIVPPPPQFASDPLWPSLGQIVGADFYGSLRRVNLNANLFAGEGLAAAGSFGIVVIGVVLILWLRIFDRVARGWDQTFVILIAVPLGMGITNSHLSTLLLSFGGFFWLATMHFFKPKSG